jgi:hypothetical protein
VLVAEPPPRPRLADDPGGWARDHWPLLTAVGVTVAAAIAFGLAVGRD